MSLIGLLLGHAFLLTDEAEIHHPEILLVCCARHLGPHQVEMPLLELQVRMLLLCLCSDAKSLPQDLFLK